MPHDPWAPLKALLRKRAREIAERKRIQAALEQQSEPAAASITLETSTHEITKKTA